MRISFDLDEVLFVNPDKYETEPPLRFPLNRIFPERLRKGTVDLIHQLQDEGFEVWVYTSSFRTKTYIKTLFRHYNIDFDDIVTGKRHQEEIQAKAKRRLPTKLPNWYRISLHIDDEDAVLTNASLYGFKAMKVYEPDDEWADKILERARRMRELEERGTDHTGGTNS